MNFRTCKYFLTVCELGTINAAARKLFISQQSLSQHIRKLEAELKVQLFHRDNPDRKSTRLNSSHSGESRMPSSA